MKHIPNNINNFDHFIKDRLGDAEVQPPDFVWCKIEKELPSQDKKRRGLFWFFLFLALGLGGGVGTFGYLNNQKSNTVAVAPNYQNSTSKVNSTVNNLPENTNQTAENSNSTQTNKNITTSPTTTQVNSLIKKTEATAQKITVASTVKQTESAKKQKQHEERLKKFEVKNQNTTSISTTNETQQNTTSFVKNEQYSKSNSISSNQKKLTKNTISNQQNNKHSNQQVSAADDLAIASANETSNNTRDGVSAKKYASNLKDSSKKQKQNSLNSINGVNTNSSTSKTTDKANTNTDNPSSAEDLTQPFVEPIRNANEEQLLASIVPVKQLLTPISSKEALRSLIDPSKLDSMDLASNAGINDLNPNKDKQLKNLKLFTGYNINKGFHIGAFIGINNNWLSNKSYSTTESATSIKPKITFGKAYGLNIGYDFKDHWGIESEIQYIEQGQKYSERNNFGLSTKSVNLNYVKAPILVKYKHSFINSYNSKPIVFSVLFGPQFSYLFKKEVLLNNQSVPSNSYNKVEGGILAGIDFDLYMTRFMYLTIGARTGFGTSFKKGTPCSYQLGVTTQFNFRIPKKIK